jgi:hypothetical protein
MLEQSSTDGEEAKQEMDKHSKLNNSTQTDREREWSQSFTDNVVAA